MVPAASDELPNRTLSNRPAAPGFCLLQGKSVPAKATNLNFPPGPQESIIAGYRESVML